MTLWCTLDDLQCLWYCHIAICFCVLSYIMSICGLSVNNVGINYSSVFSNFADVPNCEQVWPKYQSSPIIAPLEIVYWYSSLYQSEGLSLHNCYVMHWVHIVIVFYFFLSTLKVILMLSLFLLENNRCDQLQHPFLNTDDQDSSPTNGWKVGWFYD